FKDWTDEELAARHKRPSIGTKVADGVISGLDKAFSRFGFSTRDIGKLVNNMDQILTNEFRYDMRLYKIIRCLASGNLTGLTFVLGTVGTNPV
ncbi:MAG: hypothetical protein ACK53L_34025, partial [Pirellulaceae bacterium]